MNINTVGTLNQTHLTSGKSINGKSKMKTGGQVDTFTPGSEIVESGNKKLDKSQVLNESKEVKEPSGRWKSVLKFAGLTAAVCATGGAIAAGLMGAYFSMPIAALTVFLGAEPAMIAADVGLAMAGYGAAFGGAGGALLGAVTAPLLLDDPGVKK